MTIKNVIGKQFGNLTVVEQLENKGHTTQWLCKCMCGREVVRAGGSLVRAKSCGCTVGRPRGDAKRETKTYQAWAYTRNKYKRQVCTRWNNPSLFIEDMGLKPDNMYLARINQHELFSKENCEWRERKARAREKTRKNKTGYSGVQYVKRTNKFVATIHVYLGSYNKAYEAAQAHDEVAKMLQEKLGKKITLNFE